MYLYNSKDKFLFNPQKISTDLNLSLEKVMNNIDSLSDKHYIEVKVCKNDKDIMEEVVIMEGFYQKLTLLLSEDINSKDTTTSSIFEIVEKEFGRTLSPIEYEIIKAWLEDNISEEVIKEALKEATFNGVTNLRYIDKILYEWGKLGIKSKEDVDKNRIKHKRSKEKEEKVDVFDYDWFEDEDE